jgi:hypothetical protein
MKTQKVHDPSSEADYVLSNHKGSMEAVLRALSGQFQVLQGRSQMLLTISTLALTITGFSGPRIAASGNMPRVFMATGLTFVLAGTILLLVQTLTLRWVTQFRCESHKETVEAILHYRNSKTRAYGTALVVLVVGLAFYVTSVITYLIVAAPAG